jgi:signal transduction histidine kinase
MLASWLRPPRRTVRLRLTLLYGALFLASGVGLLILTNVLVRQATSNSFIAFQSTDAAETQGDGASTRTRFTVQTSDAPGATDPTVLRLLDAQAQEFREAALAERDAQRRQLVIQSGVALSMMAVVSIALGWFLAGRVLRPLRTITAAAREISVTNLHERLSLIGPDDELKELGDTFDELLGRLERAFEAQRQFVGNASHELRTPLARQRALIEVALSDPVATVESLRYTHERVLASGEQQERLIEALLTLARSERGLERHEPLDLEDVTGDVLLVMQPETERRGIRVDARLSPAPIVGDPPLVERLTTNLIENAILHNTPHGKVEVTTEEREGLAVLSVSNTGPRIEPEEVDALFQPFRRMGADRVRHADGHGLGLSIVQAVASAHGATLQASARLEGGLDVAVTFPSASLLPNA